MSEILKGKIVAFRGSHFSGLGALVIEDEAKNRTAIPCDNGPTVRALQACFGKVVAPGHSVDPNGGHVGQEIFYSYDEFGLCLGGFTPVEEAPIALVEVYEAQHKPRKKKAR